MRATWATAALIAASCLVGTSCQPEEITPPSSLAESCIDNDCHGGVEQIHYGGPTLKCVDCHGGDPNDHTKEGAHITVDVSFNPSTPGTEYMPDPTLEQLDAMDKDVLQFLNPSDYRVARRSCGADILNGVGCHATITVNSMLLNRATLAGTFGGGGYISGIQDKHPEFGVVGVVDPFVPETLPDGVVASLKALPSDPPASVTDPIAKAIFPMFEQMCVSCHVNQDGGHSPGKYYSSGCNACHMVTSDSSRAETGDITQDIQELGHVQTHRFTNEIPDSQCARCHHSHLARSLLALGVREKSEEGDGVNHALEDPEHHVPWGKQNYVKFEGDRVIFGKPWPFYIEDEDGTNDIDETPPDVHYTAGMVCGDCHVGSDVHGTGRIFETSKTQNALACEDCHGDGRQRATPDNEGVFRTSKGRALTQLYETEEGQVAQMGLVSGIEHIVPQPADVMNVLSKDSLMYQAMGDDEHGWSHTDS